MSVEHATSRIPGRITFTGGDGIYHVHLDDQHVGVVVSDWGAPRSSGQPCWTARPIADGRWGWTAPTRRDATAALIAWVKEREGMT